MARRNTQLTVVFLAVAVLTFAGFALPSPYGGMILLAIAAGLTAVLGRTWPAHGAGGRAARLAVIALLVVLAATRLV
jgi:hypothetical protein